MRFQCIEEHVPSLKFDEVKKCKESNEGEKLLHAIGEETLALDDPPLYFVPWILLDEV